MQAAAKELAADDLQGQQVFLGLLQDHDPQAYRQLPLKDPRHLVAGARRCVCPRKRCRQENWKIGGRGGVGVVRRGMCSGAGCLSKVAGVVAGVVPVSLNCQALAGVGMALGILVQRLTARPCAPPAGRVR